MEAHPMETNQPEGRTIASARHVVLINQPIDVVYGFLATLQHVPRWSPALEDDPGAERAPTVGDPAAADPRQEPAFEITGYEPPRRLALAGHIGRLEAVAEYSLDELALGTLVTLRVEVDLTELFLKRDVRVATSRIEAAVSRSLEGSKRILETEDAS
jgi:Polyketide cyclase / dehydrase and lipid transport